MNSEEVPAVVQKISVSPDVPISSVSPAAEVLSSFGTFGIIQIDIIPRRSGEDRMEAFPLPGRVHPPEGPQLFTEEREVRTMTKRNEAQLHAKPADCGVCME